MMAIECRTYPRFPCQGRAVIVLPASYEAVELRDMSLSGAMLKRSEQAHLANDSCVLRLLSRSGHQAFELDARIVRTPRPGLVAIAFEGVNAGMRKALESLLETDIARSPVSSAGICALLKYAPGYSPVRSLR